MKKKRGFSVKAKMLLASMVPLLLVTFSIAFLSLMEMENSLADGSLSGLSNLAYCAAGAYNAADPGEYTLQGDHMMKGSFDVTANEEFIDALTGDSPADLTLFYGDTRYASSLTDPDTNERIVGTKASDTVIEKTLKGGEEYRTSSIQINKEEYFAVYLPLKASDGSVVGMIFAGEPATSVRSAITGQIRSVIIVAVILFAITAVVVYIIVGRIAAMINRTGDHLAALSDGDLSQTLTPALLNRSDELGVMCRSLDGVLKKLRDILSDIQDSSGVLLESSSDLEDFSQNTKNATDEIGRAVEDMSNGSVSQAEDVENATLHVSEMGEAIQDIVDKVGTLYANSEKMEKSKNEAGEIVSELSLSSEHTFEAVKRIEAQVKLTDDSVTQIQQAVALITSIAEETNLLSLNASIEAARAGEAGKGFAVVASQIQKLAEESNGSAASIADVIENLSRESKNTVEEMNSVHDIIIDQQQKLTDTESKFSELSAGIQKSLEQIEEIRRGSQVCNSARAKVTDLIQNLSAVSEQNAAATEQTSASMEELNSTMSVLAEKSEQLGTIAGQLEENLRFFKMK